MALFGRVAGMEKFWSINWKKKLWKQNKCFLIIKAELTTEFSSFINYEGAQ